MKFYDREKELEVLQRALHQRGSAMIVISGRRRVGKSRLVDEFLKKNKGLKIMVVPKEEKQVAADFAEVLSDGFKPSFGSVKEALEYFFAKSSERVFYIDEFPNLLDVNPSIPYELQRIWEEYKDKTDKILILSGSYVSMMDKIFTKQKAPLFNRATFKILLQPLTHRIVWAIQNDLGAHDPATQISNYCIFGGIPYYYEVLEKQGSPLLSAESLFFDIGQLREEGQDILRQEFGSAYKKYFSILEAIGSGLVSAGEIADKMGIRQTTLSKYMMSLQNDFKLVGRTVPFGQNPSRSKKGLYMIKDNLLAFWFSCVYGKTRPPSKGELNAFVGKRFELLCADFLLEYLQGKGEEAIKASRWWGAVRIGNGKFEQREIDLIAETGKGVYICECKWTEQKIGETELHRLQESAAALKFKKPITWVLFSRNGFSAKGSANVLLFDAGSIVNYSPG